VSLTNSYTEDEPEKFSGAVYSFTTENINLTPKVVCNKVAIPDTKKIVLNISLMTSLLP